MKKTFVLIFFFVTVLHAIILALHFEHVTEQKLQAVLKVRIEDHYRSTKRQIVESEDGEGVQDRPLDDAYLSDKTRYFSRESQSRNIGKFHSGGADGIKSKKEMQLSDLSTYSKGHDPLKVEAKKYLQKTKGKLIADQSRGVSSSSDHLLNVAVGDFTYLNSVEYKYYGFFHRIRQKLEQFWGRSLQEKSQILIKMGRSLASMDEHVTSLQITLSEKGEVIEIVIRGTSGVRELDDAAIESFNDAGPFPNPPRGLIDNGRVTIEWGFVVKT